MIERNKEIVRLWNEDKLSASQIGAQLGLTKNTIIGTVKRARAKGLITKGKDRNNAERGKLGHKRKGWRESDRRADKASKGSLPKLFVAVKEEQSPQAVGVSFMDLAHTGCRYPTSRFDGEHYFCGEPKRDTKTSYCEHHHSLCWHKKKRMTEAEMLKLKSMYAKRVWMQSKEGHQ